MITGSTLMHLRFPFSFFLLPVYLIALMAAEKIDPANAWQVFAVLHFLLYPASNGFNSYYDRDRESIGALRTPPPVTPDLLRVSLFLDALAVLLAFNVGWVFAAGCFIYGLASKAYSWPAVRIKRRPFLGWIFTGAGQGSLTFLLVYLSVQPNPHFLLPDWPVLFLAGAAGLFLLGLYPVTQVYQHAEDSRRGDRTISLVLGVRGTFYLAAILMMLTLPALAWYYYQYESGWRALFFGLMILPGTLYFLQWFRRILKDGSQADFGHTMAFCVLVSTGILLFSVSTLFPLIRE